MTAKARALHTPPEISFTRMTGEIDPLFDEVTLATWEPRNSNPFIEVVMPDWTGPSFDDLARTDPERLLQLIASNTLAFHDLTFAAEAAGKINTEAARRALLELLKHQSPLVREGAVYGLTKHVHAQKTDWVRTRLEYLSQKDPVAGVREAAREALEDAIEPAAK